VNLIEFGKKIFGNLICYKKLYLYGIIKINKMKYSILFLIPIIIFFESCKIGTNETLKDERINQNLKTEIEKLDKEILKAVSTNDTELLKTIMSEQLIEESKGNLNQIIEHAGEIITSSEYQILNQFYVKNSTEGINNTIQSFDGKLNDYIIQYKALNKDIFVSLLIPKGESSEDFVITNIYGKYSEGWKLNIIQFGRYKVEGETAPELYMRAKDEYSKGNLIDAANIIYVSSQIAKPSGVYWTYKLENERKDFEEKIIKEANEKYSFPLTIQEVETKPQILTIYPKATEEGFFPMIEYLTKIDLKDTIATKSENDQIHNIIGKTFKGIDKNKKYIFYRAFSEISETKPISSYGFVKTIEE